MDDYIKNNPLSIEDKTNLALEIIQGITYLHALGLYHGDLHPKNIIVNSSEGVSTFIIDTIEYYEGDVPPHNTAYAPTDYESCQPIEVDNYAAGTLVCDIFGIDKSAQSLPEDDELTKTLKHFLLTPPYITIEKITKSLKDVLTPPKKLYTYDISIAKLSASEDLLSDNGAYYVATEHSKRSTSDVFIWVTGVRKKITLIVDKNDFTLKRIKLDDISHQELQRTIRNSNTLIQDSEIKITNGTIDGAEDLLTCLKTLVQIENIKDDDLSDEDLDAPSSIYSYSESTQIVRTSTIWETVLSMEEELQPEIEVTGTHEIVGNHLFIPYTSETLDFDSNDRVEVYIHDNENNRKIGYMNIRKSDNDILVIDEYKNLGQIRLGVKLKLLNQQTKSSYQRRKSALERLLNNKSVIRNLIDYFDPNVNKKISPSSTFITEDELDEYNVYDNGKLIYGLNPQQRIAFNKIFTSSPLSLLQGPPGTGKTAFIASFVHYLVKNGYARHILLVSQSHEAVNNAIEGINELCEKTKLSLDIVRFGSEGMLSDSIRHLHISSIQYKYRETFRASLKSRVTSLSTNLQLPKDFVENYFDLEFHLGFLLKEFNRISTHQDNNHKSHQIQSRIYSIAKKFFNYSGDQLEPDELFLFLKKDLINKFNINSSLALKKLDQVLQISFEWIDVLAIQRGNFDEFLAKTRTLVCGTCVGIGQWHMGIANNQYDWVIVDEAARATASELAIAMQTGKRILLVGDHLQLPPQYNPKDLLTHVSQRLSVDEQLIRKSDFERAFQSEYGNTIGVTLSTQYRMASAIGAMVSFCFYKNELKTGRGEPSAYYQHLPSPLDKAQVIWMDTSAEGTKSYETSILNSGYFNTYEVDVVLELLKDISNSEDFLLKIKNDLHDSEKLVGIICMYAEQKRAIIKRIIESDAIGSEFKKSIKVDTVDSYQGKENQIIILSLTRNNPQAKQGFLNDHQRINVALSRAKNRLVIVGSSKIWEHEKNKNSALGSALNFINEHKCSDEYSIYDTKRYIESRS